MAKRRKKGYAERRLEQKRRQATVSDMTAQQQLAWLRQKLTPPLWPQLVKPNGFLDETREAQACWTYYLWARKTYETWMEDLRLEGDGDFSDMPLQPNYRQLFKSVAVLYNVEPDGVAQCWDMVDMQCAVDQLPPMPKGDRYRHDAAMEISVRPDDGSADTEGQRDGGRAGVDAATGSAMPTDNSDIVPASPSNADQRAGGRIYTGTSIGAALRERNGRK